MVFNSLVWINCIIGILLNLLIFAGPVTIGAIFSIGALAQYIAFITPVALRVIFVRQHFRSGPWNLGRFSRQCGFMALAWVLLIIPVLCFPAVRGSDLNLSMMNWTSLIYGGTMLIVLIWYAIDARNWFKGPKVATWATLTKEQINVEHHHMLKQFDVIDTGDLQPECSAIIFSGETEEAEALESSSERSQLVPKEKTDLNC